MELMLVFTMNCYTYLAFPIKAIKKQQITRKLVNKFKKTRKLAENMSLKHVARYAIIVMYLLLKHNHIFVLFVTITCV